VAHREGLIVLDDTQALGIMGFDAKSEAPYGSGGGGSLRLAGLRDPRVVLVSSLAKAFGAPVAMAAGSRHVISEYRDSSATRMHCSPPSVASIAAAAHALAVNARCGDALRCALAHRVARFRRGLGPLAAAAGAFPVQHLRLPVCTDPTRVHARLRKRGVQTVLSRVESARASIAFVLTARHADHEIDEALDALATATRTGTTRAGWGGGSANGR
jgi:8-amino-7-oxononanoate synthase